MPDTWPRDVPVPAGKITGSGSSSLGAARADFITVDTATSPASIVAKYRQQLLQKGWLGTTVKTAPMARSSRTLLTAHKGNRLIQVLITPSTLKRGYSIRVHAVRTGR